ncbi:MAG TPA: DUF190 domain-containing protein [Synergistaceae bacterium]|nr:DUF190 domain-containing protein [Synergistaceae bacterium]HPJ25397.1 DUF190 domain-containing protein [Synergistaceae bacterium]HPQ37580.1 DUF190 domain-containing protein [Synergistaceae bacterium]
MQEPGEARLLRIFIGEADKAGRRPLYEVIVEEARKAGMAGATVIKGVMGFGKKSRSIHSAKILRLSEDLPLIVEIVDLPEKVEAFLPLLESLMGGGLVTIEKIRVLAYREAKRE